MISGKEEYSEHSRIDTTAHAPYWLDIVKQKVFQKMYLYGI